MANWNDLKAAVASTIKTNNNQEITGQILQNILNSIISNVGANATFAGVATPSTNPGTPDGNVFYIASKKGIYSNFSEIVLESGIYVLYNNGNDWAYNLVYSVDYSYQYIDLNNVKKIFNVPRRYIVRSTGRTSLANSDNYVGTDYIPIDFLRNVKITGLTDNTSGACIGFFDFNNNALGAYTFDNIGTHEITITDDIIEMFPGAVYIILADTASANNVSFPMSNPELYNKLNTDIKSINTDIKSINTDIKSINTDIKSINTKFDGTSDIEIYNEYSLPALSFTNTAYHFLQAIENIDEKVLSKIKIHVGTISDTLTIGLATINTDLPTESSDIDIYWSTQIEIQGEAEQKDIKISIPSLPTCKPNSYLYVHRAGVGNVSSLGLYIATGKTLYRYNNILTGYGYVPIQDKQMMIELTFGVEGIDKKIDSLTVDVEKLNIKNNKAITSISYVVDKNGKGDYTKIQDAIDAAQNGDIIYVMPGEYEENLDMGIKIISLIGQNPHNTIVFSSVGTYAEPPLECCHGLIEGIQFHAIRESGKEYTEVSYCWHLDQRWGEENTRQVIARNCIFRTELRASCIGVGVTDKCTILLDGCEVYMDYDDKTNRNAMQVHGDDNTEHASEIIFRNCKLIGKNGGGLLITNGPSSSSASKITIHANNSYFTGFYENIGDGYVKGGYNHGNNLSELNS